MMKKNRAQLSRNKAASCTPQARSVRVALGHAALERAVAELKPYADVPAVARALQALVADSRCGALTPVVSAWAPPAPVASLILLRQVSSLSEEHTPREEPGGL